MSVFVTFAPLALGFAAIFSFLFAYVYDPPRPRLKLAIGFCPYSAIRLDVFRRAKS